MYMNLYDLGICHADDGIADRLQKCLEFPLFFFGKFFLQQDDKFGTVAETDLFFFSRSRYGRSGCLFLRQIYGIINLFSKICVVSAL